MQERQRALSDSESSFFNNSSVYIKSLIDPKYV